MSPSHAAVDHSDMAPLTRRQVLAMLGAGGGLIAVGYAVRGIVGMAVSERWASDAPGMRMMEPGLMGTGMMMSRIERDSLLALGRVRHWGADSRPWSVPARPARPTA